MAARDATGGVQKTYTEEEAQAVLAAKQVAGGSLRAIAQDYPGLTHADIQRALHGVFPKAARKRAALGLSPLVPAPACPICGAAHTIDGVCTAGKAVTVTVTDAPGEMRIRMRPPRKTAPAPDPIWAGITFPRRGADWGPQPGPAVDLDPRAEAIRLALAVLGGHGWTDRMLWFASAALEAVLEVQQERDG